MLDNLTALRTVTNVIQSLPPKELPQRTQFFVSAISASSAILSSPENHLVTKDGTDRAVLVHKYKTQLSALLNGKSQEGRWIAVVLIKSTIHAGGWEILRGCESWVRGLLGLLNKPSPPSTKILEILTLSRVYDLLQEYPTLVREIATPTLPTCITGCIKIISKKTSGSTHTIEPEGSTSVLQAVLEMFNLLLPIYSTVFRPFSGQLHAIVTPLLAPTQQLLVKGNGLVDEDIVLELARQLFANLHFCAPKNTNGDYWKKSFDSLKEETHLTVDQVFRGIIEDWESSDGSSRPIQPQASYREPMSIRDSPLSLPRFRGVFEGVQRLVGLLQTLRVILASKSATPVQLRLGVISDLISRLTSITAPAGSGSQNEPRINPEIDRFERDAMFCELPKIHIAAMRVLLMLCRRLENGFAPFTNNAIDQVLWIFEAEKDSENVRTTAYKVAAVLLKLGGSSISTASTPLVSKLIRSCCDDLLPTPLQPRSIPKPTTQNGVSKNTNPTINADSYLMEASSLESSFKPLSPGLQDAASTLLPVLLTNLPTSTLVPSIRAQIDRTAILTKNKAAMIASVLNPQPARKGAKVVSSILPHLARAYGGDQDVEGLLRPRMPVIITGSKMEDLATDYEKDQDSIGQDEAASYSPSNDIQGSPNTSYRPMEIEYHQTQSPADAKQPTAATDAAKPRVYSDVLAASKTAAVAASKGTSPPPKSTKRSHDLDSNEAPQPHEHASKRPKAAVAAAAETLEEDRRILRQLKSSTEYSSSSSSTKPETLPHEVSTNLQSSSGQQQKAAADDEDDEDEDDFDIPKVVLDADTSSDDAEDDES